MGVNVVVSSGNLNVVTSQRVLSALPATWDEWVSGYGRGYNYPPPSGQTTIYRVGDDAWVEQNYFGATVRNAQTLKARNTLSDTTTLNNTNAFGNTNRFTNSLGGTVYDGSDGSIANYKIDHYTGLGYYLVALPNSIWDDFIDALQAGTWAGFTDWFAMNISQLESIEDGSTIQSFNNVFPLYGSGYRWTSQTYIGNTAQAFARNQYGANAYRSANITKTTSYASGYPCRKHF